MRGSSKVQSSLSQSLSHAFLRQKISSIEWAPLMAPSLDIEVAPMAREAPDGDEEASLHKQPEIVFATSPNPIIEPTARPRRHTMSQPSSARYTLAA